MKTILVVDDSESVREVVNFTLSNAGYQTIIAVDGREALGFLDGKHIDLIITDLHMPKMDGIELIKRVRKMEAYARIPILFLTTESQREKKMEAKSAGATGWIIKPFVPAKLLHALSRIIRN